MSDPTTRLRAFAEAMGGAVILGVRGTAMDCADLRAVLADLDGGKAREAVAVRRMVAVAERLEEMARAGKWIARTAGPRAEQESADGIADAYQTAAKMVRDAVNGEANGR